MDERYFDSDEQQIDVTDCQIYRNNSGKVECRTLGKSCHTARYYRRIRLCTHPLVRTFPELSE